ncbi:hypothetical protein R6Q59_036873 [Mikania micrantha]
MDIPAPELRQPASTPPKLSLFSLPFKQPTLPDTGVTPPLNTAAAAIPFLWEEAPGKPRPVISGDPPKSKTVRSLDLPPRLASLSPAYNNGNNHRDKFGNNAGMEIIPSPTTVLGGPYEGLYASNLALESSEKVNKSKEKISMPLRKLMKERSPVIRSVHGSGIVMVSGIVARVEGIYHRQLGFAHGGEIVSWLRAAVAVALAVAVVVAEVEANFLIPVVRSEKLPGETASPLTMVLLLASWYVRT